MNSRLIELQQQKQAIDAELAELQASEHRQANTAELHPQQSGRHNVLLQQHNDALQDMLAAFDSGNVGGCCDTLPGGA